MENINYKDIKKHYETFFVPNNTILGITGDFKIENLKKIINKYYGNLESKNINTSLNITRNDFYNLSFNYYYDPIFKTTEVYLIISSISLGNRYDKVIIQKIILALLNRLRSSRLFKILKQQKGLVYYINSTSYFSDKKFGGVYIDFSSKLENVLEILNIIYNNFKDLMLNGPKEKELKLAKNYLINRNKLSYDKPSVLIDLYIDSYLDYNEVISDKKYEYLVNKIKTEDVKKFIQKYWDFNNSKLLIINGEENNKIIDKIRNFF